ncbi:MAG: membrane protein insertase YidC, partial [Gammaproteobacteria bacterium]|nr:membrane protein insertase YidC [Gammaproteobacteria bacterium]
MDNQRLLVWAAFGLMLWFAYQAWMMDYGPKPVAPAAVEAPAATDFPDDIDGGLPELAEPGPSAPVLEPDAPEEPEARPTGSLRVTTDVLELEISLQGGTLQKAALLRYPVAKDRPNQLVELLSREPSNLGLIQTGLRTADDGPEPNHQAIFSAEKDRYVLGDRD